jgi:hypothetical protein
VSSATSASVASAVIRVPGRGAPARAAGAVDARRASGGSGAQRPGLALVAGQQRDRHPPVRRAGGVPTASRLHVGVPAPGQGLGRRDALAARPAAGSSADHRRARPADRDRPARVGPRGHCGATAGAWSTRPRRTPSCSRRTAWVRRACSSCRPHPSTRTAWPTAAVGSAHA